MRRTAKEMKKLRLKIIEMKKEGKSYEEIRRTTSASPNTIARILKRFSGRYCVMCGETNPDVLHEHHPDKKNRPDYTITLCANCHNELHRSKFKENSIKKISETSNQVIKISQMNALQPEITKQHQITINPSTQVFNYVPPVTFPDVKKALFLTSGVMSIIEGLFNRDIKSIERLIFVGLGSFLILKYFERH